MKRVLLVLARLTISVVVGLATLVWLAELDQTFFGKTCRISPFLLVPAVVTAWLFDKMLGWAVRD